MKSVVMVERSENWVLITLNRPEVRNALNTDLLLQLQKILKDISEENNVRAVIIAGSGDKAFSAGADLKERQSMTEEQAFAFVALIRNTFDQIAQMPMPTISALNGDAFGGGLELALACDFRVANRHAKLGLTECALGIIPGAGGTQRLSRLVGLSKAKELIFMAKRLDVSEANTIGLINAIAHENQTVQDLAKDWARQMAQNAPLSLRYAKRAIEQGSTLDMPSALKVESDCYQAILYTEDRKEGLLAFKEKRAPRFLGR